MYTSPIMTSLAGAAVALVILVDLATGQGPPIYTNYLASQQNYRAPPAGPVPVSAGLYQQRGEFGPAKTDKELDRAIELGKVEPAKESLSPDKKYEKELDKSHGKEFAEKRGDYETSPSPSMLSSLSNSMSDAWNRFSTLGRSTRSVNNVDQKSSEESSPKNKTDSAASTPAKPVTASSGRTIDSYEYLQQRQNGYIYFKVPKYLVCGY